MLWKIALLAIHYAAASRTSKMQILPGATTEFYEELGIVLVGLPMFSLNPYPKLGNESVRSLTLGRFAPSAWPQIIQLWPSHIPVLHRKVSWLLSPESRLGLRLVSPLLLHLTWSKPNSPASAPHRWRVNRMDRIIPTGSNFRRCFGAQKFGNICISPLMALADFWYTYFRCSPNLSLGSINTPDIW